MGLSLMRNYPYPPGDSEIKWVSPDWLDEKKEDVFVLDVQPNVHDYIMGHIPGAVYMNEGLLRATRRRQPASFVPAASIEIIFGTTGISREVPVVVYSGPGVYSRCTAGLGDGLEQTMVAYALARFGHDEIYILDGGIDAWLASGRRLTKEFPDAEEGQFKSQIRHEYFIEMEELKSIIGRDDVIIFDARPTESYEGQAMWMKPGHIPGAYSLPWRRLMTEKNSRLLKSDEELRALIKNFDLEEKRIIVYCGTGREATNEFIFFKWYLGCPDVKIYEGSFTEWSSYPESPTVTGPNPG